MTSVFDGIGTITRGVFGDAVTIFPGGASVGTGVRAIFRALPVVQEDAYSEMEVRVPDPMLRGDRTELSGLVAGDVVEPGDGKTYVVVDFVDEGSPAADGLVSVRLKLKR